jgi:hypothetical protein
MAIFYLPKKIKITFLLFIALSSTQRTFRSLKPTESKSKSHICPPTANFGHNFEFILLIFSGFTSKICGGRHLPKQRNPWRINVFGMFVIQNSKQSK